MDQKYLKECLHYDPETGIFTWIKSTSNRSPVGSVAGTMKSDSKSRTKYIVIKLLGNFWRAHRLAWLYVHGEMPDFSIDHINGNGTDNRISNLRDVPHRENHMNIRRRRDNTSGATGVSFDKSRGKWLAEIQDNGKKVHLGRFGNIESAVAARKSAEKKFGYHENHGSELLC